MNKYELINQTVKSTNEKKRVAAYCRVSTDSEDQVNSFESQQRYFRQYIEQRPDWELYEIFADEGISGTNTKKRREFNRMIDCAKSGKIDLIITKEISRFARNTLDSIYYTRELKKRGVGVIFMNDNINTLDGDAELRLAIMASIAQEESRKTSERVKWGQKRRMEEGVVFGRSMLGYDVRGGKMYINQGGAEIVRLIFHKFVSEGKGTHVIAKELCEEGISPMRVKKWHSSVILRIIRNEKYCGDLIQKKTYTPDFLSHEKKYNKGQEKFIIIKNHHEPIISREIFEQANRILDERSLSQEGKNKYSRRYTFSGKIKCGCCGKGCSARYKVRRDGSVYKSWRCSEASKYGAFHIDALGNRLGCDGASIRNDDAVYLMSLVTKKLNLGCEENTGSLISVIKSVLKENKDIALDSLKEDIKTVENNRHNLVELFFSGRINESEFNDAEAVYSRAIRQLRINYINICKNETKTTEHRTNTEQRTNTNIEDIYKIIKEIISGVEYEDDFYRCILDKMVVIDHNNVDIYLKGLSHKFSYKLKSDIECT